MSADVPDLGHCDPQPPWFFVRFFGDTRTLAAGPTNMISASPRGAVVGLDHSSSITSDLSSEGAQRFAQVVFGPAMRVRM